MSCQPGGWSNDPSFTYTFIDAATGAVLQSGSSPDYQLATAALGGGVIMRLQATNAGGTAVNRTQATAPVTPAPPAQPSTAPSATSARISLAATKLALHGGAASVRLTCAGSSACSGRLALTVRQSYLKRGRRRTRTLTLGSATFSIAPGATVSVRVALDAAGRHLLRARHGQLACRLTILKLSPNPRQTLDKPVTLRA